jgi:hypothetical protein
MHGALLPFRPAEHACGLEQIHFLHLLAVKRLETWDVFGILSV